MSESKAGSPASNSMPVISVLMAAYNGQAYVAQAIRSLQNQSIPNIEIVVVNDGSTDDTLQILESLAAVDPRIRILDIGENKGCVAARNLGLSQCRSAYIGELDQDDLAAEDRFAKQLAYLTEHPEVALVGGDVASIDLQGRVVSLTGASPLLLTERAIRRGLLLGSPCYHSGWLARRELYAQLAGYRELTPCEDYDFLLRAISSGHKIANIPDHVAMIRLHPGQVSRSSGLQQRKMHRYVVKLYQDRMRRKVDPFNGESAKQAVSSGPLARTLHRFSVRCVGAGFQSKSRLPKLLLLAAACASPWQAKYFIDRFRVRLISKSSLNRET
jgi:glycosyltransferase involved in cell wall biosynthesis